MAKIKKQKNKRRFTKQRYQTTDRVTQTPLQPGGELRCYGRITAIFIVLHQIN
jgi:hypothetical protein